MPTLRLASFPISIAPSSTSTQHYQHRFFLWFSLLLLNPSISRSKRLRMEAYCNANARMFPICDFASLLNLRLSKNVCDNVHGEIGRFRLIL
ncbi:hypothetical protein SLEP1_g18897 [Rubroshorea leprosula]|uniref:Secreted protein n=1 Tax=Rubroshorea leprosula TaxID=152421 RepID=A0AAV5J513_9ROSI|nr:hypothetical protein SLEP1_g18897 [Rubroshorea leprosula]